MEYKNFADTIEEKYGFVPTLATIPREKPVKRVESVSWQLEEGYATLSCHPFSIPREDSGPNKFYFGSITERSINSNPLPRWDRGGRGGIEVGYLRKLVCR